MTEITREELHQRSREIAGVMRILVVHERLMHMIRDLEKAQAFCRPRPWVNDALQCISRGDFATVLKILETNMKDVSDIFGKSLIWGEDPRGFTNFSARVENMFREVCRLPWSNDC